jgi:hypothetical protein
MIFGFLSMVIYRENPYQRWAEYSLIGLAVGYSFVVTVWRLVGPGGYLEPLLTGADYLLIIPVILGLLLYLQFTRYRWVIRWPLAVLTGVSFTLGLTGIPLTMLMQIRSVAVPLTTGSTFDAINAIITIVGVITTLSYFTFSFEHKGALGLSAKIGRWVMMIGFGAGFGIAVMSQGNFLLNVILFLLRDWLGVLA